MGWRGEGEGRNPGESLTDNSVNTTRATRIALSYLYKSVFKGRYCPARWIRPKLGSFDRSSLKGPKHEIFESGFFSQIRGLWLGDLGTGEKN